MEEITLKLETVTPLFIAGADQKNIENEGLRAPSLRGVLRWWFRALKATDNLQELSKEENEIFGFTKFKSKVSIKIKTVKSIIEKELKLNTQFDRKNSRIVGKDAGIGYLLSILRERPYIAPESTFLVYLYGKEDALKNALASLWCAIYLGNFGARSRRGAGSFAVIPQENSLKKIASLTENKLDFYLNKDGSEEILNWVSNNLKNVEEIVNREKPRNFTTRFSNLCLSRILISKEPKNSWKEALNEIGKIYEEYRFNHRGEYLDAGAFGLPIVQKNVSAKIKDERIDRRASPLIFKVLKSSNKYYWALIRLSGEFLPHGGIVTNGRSSQKPDYKFIDEFWNKAREYGHEKILLIPKILDEIIDKIKKEVNPDKIILYGSRTRGDAYKFSDIDLAVESEKPVLREDIPADIVWLKDASPEIKEKIEQEGVLLYERKG